MWSWITNSWWHAGLAVLVATVLLSLSLYLASPRIRTEMRSYAVLKTVPRSYWGVQSVNFLDCFYGFAFSTFSMLIMREEFGLKEDWSGYLLAGLGIAGFLTTFAAGPVVDRFGLRRSLLWSLVVVIVFRLGMAACVFVPGIPHRVWFFFGLSILAGLPAAVKSNAYHIGNKRFSSPEARTHAFSLSYIVMNFAALFALPLVDAMEHGLKLPYSWVFVIGIAVAVLATVSTALFVRDEHAADEPATATGKRQVRAAHASFLAVCREPTFRRMIVIVAATLGVSTIFKYWIVLSPLYWKRTMGATTAIGTLSAINPLLIIILLFAITPFIRKVNTFRVVTWGTVVAAASMIPLFTPWQWWNDDVFWAYLTMNVTAMVIFSFGEILFSPRLSQYILDIAPKGQEGIYSSFATVPHFLANTMVNILCGLMLMRWSPETAVLPDGRSLPLQDALATGQMTYGHTPEMMWLILAVFAFAGPLVLFPLRSWFMSVMKTEEKKAPAA
jgi:MFS family permease